MAKELDLRSAQYSELKYTPGGAVPAGEFTVVNDINGFPIANLVASEEGVLITKADKVMAAKDATVAVNAGEKAYFNTTNNNMTNVVGANILSGHFVEDAVSAATEVLVFFDGEINN